MVILESKKAFNDLFEETIATLSLKDNFINLEFKKPFSIGRGKNYKVGESLIYEVFSPKDIVTFKQKTGISKIPCDLINNELFKKVFFFMGGQ